MLRFTSNTHGRRNPGSSRTRCPSTPVAVLRQLVRADGGVAAGGFSVTKPSLPARRPHTRGKERAFPGRPEGHGWEAHGEYTVR